MSIIKITDLDGNYVNQISADLASAEEVYPNHQYEEIVDIELTMEDMMSSEDNARMWRNEELSGTDAASQTPDWPNRDNILTYRAALRAWPSTSDFPDTKPVLGS
jgi:hypothetical protein